MTQPTFNMNETPCEIPPSVNQVTRTGAMQAFQVLRSQAKNNGVSDMTLDEINEEISKARREAAG